MRYGFSGGAHADWHMGGQYTRVTRHGYTEENADFAVVYDGVTMVRTALYARGESSVPVVANLSWVSRLDIVQRVKGKTPDFRAKGKYLGGYRYYGDMANTEGSVSSGIACDISQNVKLTIMSGVSRTGQGDTDWGGTVSMGGKF